MSLKVRHPYQIMEIDELVKGNQYIFTGVFKGQYSDIISSYFFGGTLKNNNDVCENSLPKEYTMTIHLDGINSLFEPVDKPTFIFWRAHYVWWSFLCSYMDDNSPDSHLIIVPKEYWDNDPKIHVIDWKNPDDVIERKSLGVSMDVDMDIVWEKRINARRDRAMAKALGF